MPRKHADSELSRRERQIMDAVYHHEKASVSTILESIPDPPSYSAVRATVRLLEDKGHLTHRLDGQRYIYSPKVSCKRASKSALSRVVDTFFGGSTGDAVAALINTADDLSAEQLDHLEAMIAKARKEGSK